MTVIRPERSIHLQYLEGVGPGEEERVERVVSIAASDRGILRREARADAARGGAALRGVREVPRTSSGARAGRVHGSVARRSSWIPTAKVPEDAVVEHLRFARLTRVSIEGNADFCRGVLAVRYGMQEEEKEEATL